MLFLFVGVGMKKETVRNTNNWPGKDIVENTYLRRINVIDANDCICYHVLWSSFLDRLQYLFLITIRKVR